MTNPPQISRGTEKGQTFLAEGLREQPVRRNRDDDPSMTECIEQQLEFHGIGGRHVVAGMGEQRGRLIMLADPHMVIDLIDETHTDCARQ
ncbi:hypothetical protein [Thiocapsa imhoffii]|uniref:hypothetical protein n=1 Tax=Thiocapsa imhoffii TaxID=382777 RepID=UPI0019042EAC|nr:hypothetical protein [Thiocapsa imhoffii]